MRLNEAWEKLLTYIYDKVLRPHIPRKLAVLNGVVTRDAGLLDKTDVDPQYKNEFISAIHDNIRDGDTVCLVGAGRGVTSIHSVWAGADHVIAYEAAEEMVEIAREAAQLNHDISESDISIRHGLVGENVVVYGSSTDAESISPAELETGDVLIMDCEGAERSILRALNDIPQTCIVETHAERGVPAEETKSQLSELGYECIWRHQNAPVVVATELKKV